MTGSSYIPVVVPIVAFVTMALWLGLVFHADRHPGYRRRTPQGASGSVAAAPGETAGAAPGPEHEALPDARVPAGPREHERIDEDAFDTLLR